MPEIPQRELRNNVSAVLRAAEAGKVYTVTVDGRPVAQLGPHRPRQWVAADDVHAILDTPTDPSLLDDVIATGLAPDAGYDPWRDR